MSVSLDDATEGFEPKSDYLDSKEKHLWAENHVAFDIYTIKPEPPSGKFPASWVVGVSTVATDDDEPEHRKIRLGANPRRDQLMEHLQVILRDGRAVGPVMLQNLGLEGGLSTWLIVAWTPEPQQQPFSAA
jgi:hypothetical protein